MIIESRIKVEGISGSCVHCRLPVIKSYYLQFCLNRQGYHGNIGDRANIFDRHVEAATKRQKALSKQRDNKNLSAVSQVCGIVL